jgi:hypothetical protein
VIVRLLQPADDRSGFSCGDSDYDDYIRKYAGQDDFRHQIGRTLVVVDDERVVVVVDALCNAQGFYERLGFEHSGAVVGRPRVTGTVLMSLPLSYVEAALENPESDARE